MEQKLGNLIPGATLIYERVDGTVYARYRDPPHNSIPRWVIGGTGNKQVPLTFAEWSALIMLAEDHPTLKIQLDKLLDVYYLIKDSK